MSKLRTQDLDLYYGDFHALKSVSLTIAERRITALIGPSGCGKSTLLRTFNRMNDLISGVRVSGVVEMDGQAIYGKDGRSSWDIEGLRKRIGMVFQRPNPFPLSIFENVAYGPRVHGMYHGAELQAVVERSLQAVQLWPELRDRLNHNALSLSGEQQQRLCVARVLAVESEVLLMDEPCSALDPLATLALEDLMRELSQRYTIVVVTHNMQQAARVSQDTGFMLLGELVEFGPTTEIFRDPRDPRTRGYVTGRFG